MSTQIEWLLEGDPAIQYLTYRDLLHASKEQCDAYQARLERDGICAKLLSCQRVDGHWGLYYYQPKWTSTHYTLLLLKDIGAPPALEACRRIIFRMFEECFLPNGGMNLSKHEHPSDTCVDGMVLSYASYFCPEESRLDLLASHILAEQKPDGGFTWDAGSDQGDPHTTICVLEGLGQYAASHAAVDAIPVDGAIRCGVEFLLANNLFLDGADRRFLKLIYPSRYRYDVLRALECFVRLAIPFDARMRPAVLWLVKRRTSEGVWLLEHVHAGHVHFALEETGKPSRFVTWKAMTVLGTYGRDASRVLNSDLV